VVEMLGANEAAFHNGHTTTDMVSRVYDIRRNERLTSAIISLGNEFA
jgi:hypothetical protein